MKRFSLHPIKLTLIGTSLIVTGCSFQKNKKDPQGPETKTTVIVEQPAQTSKTALEALQTKDLESFKKLLQSMSTEEVNAYTSDGSTLLETAVVQSNLVAVELLLEKGALPLKGQKNAPENTPLKISENLNASIFNALTKAVNKSKSEATDLIKNQKYNEAVKFLEAHSISVQSALAEGQNILDLILSQESTLNEPLQGLFSGLLQKQVPLAASADKLLKIALEDSTLFDATLTEAARQNVTLSSDLVYGLIQSSSLKSLKDNLVILNNHKLSSSKNLRILQNDVLAKFLESLKPGELLPLQSFQQVLALLPAQASEKDFCSECIELTINSNKISTQRGDIVRLLILNSQKAPQGFMTSLLGRLTPADFRLVVEALPAEIRKTQVDVFDGSWSAGEYKTLRDNGMQISSKQGRTKFLSLLEKRYQGDKTALELIAAMSADLKKMPGLLEANEQRDITAKEFFFVLNSDLREKDVFDILAAVKTGLMPGIYLGEIAKGDSILDRSEESLWVNPFYVLQSLAAKGVSTQFSLNLSNFMLSLSKVVNAENLSWLLKSDSWTMTDKDLFWIQLLETEKAVQSIYPQLGNPLVKQAISKWMILEKINQDGTDAATILIQKINPKFADLDSIQREKLLKAILMSPSTLIKKSIVIWFIDSAINSLQKFETNFSLGLADFALTINSPEEMDGFFSATILPYMRKTTPRLALALDDSYRASYIKFLSGDLSADPLCFEEASKNSLKHCSKEIGSGSLFDGRTPSRDIKTALDDIVREQKIKNSKIMSIIQDDVDTVKALLKIKEKATSTEIKRFFDANSWLSDVRFFEGKTIIDQGHAVGKGLRN